MQIQKWASKKIIAREYHVHEDADVAKKCVKMFLNKNQFP